MLHSTRAAKAKANNASPKTPKKACSKLQSPEVNGNSSIPVQEVTPEVTEVTSLPATVSKPSNDVIALRAANIEAHGDIVDEKDDEVSPAKKMIRGNRRYHGQKVFPSHAFTSDLTSPGAIYSCSHHLFHCPMCACCNYLRLPMPWWRPTRS